ncbi:flagellar motor switch protein FliM [Sphingomonas hylomeconis]|uniref:Flagellar motor switch protein FliM n=1 Tax=Sphingomonas hylomeconis TaxID=1395958 RepID=A0ABV7SQG7_9SPHN|nr:flagellar motor switch protein FliM [Sphingomonas hylomeconis]
MSDDFDDFALPDPPLAAVGGDGNFDQAGIDALFGDLDAPIEPKHGLRAVIESDVISHERLPMLEVVFDRMVRLFATSMRNLTSDAIDVSLEDVTSVRFGDFLNHVALPAMIGVFRVEEWENYGLVTVESGLIYAVVDALLGGRRGGEPMMIDGRGFTTIESDLIARMLRQVLADMGAALTPITPTTVALERIETSPRFASIAGSSNICAVASFRVDMEERGGRFSILLPYATIEPVRHILSQRFMGEKLGRDGMWEAHMAAQIRETEVTIEAVLGERLLPLATVTGLAVGQTISLHRSPDDPVLLTSGGVPLAQGQIGQRSNNIAVRMITDLAMESRS